MKNKPSNKTCVFTKICLVFTLQNNWVHSCGSQEIAAIGVDYFDKGHALVAVASAKAFLVLSKSSATVRGKWTGHQGDEFQAVPKMKSSPLNQTTSRSMEQVSPFRCSVLLHGFNFATQGLSCKKVGKESWCVCLASLPKSLPTELPVLAASQTIQRNVNNLPWDQVFSAVLLAAFSWLTMRTSSQSNITSQWIGGRENLEENHGFLPQIGWFL